MKKSLAAAKQLTSQREVAAGVEELLKRLERIEAKIDALLAAQKPAKAAKPAKAEAENTNGVGA